jgi:hypothetical protein
MAFLHSYCQRFGIRTNPGVAYSGDEKNKFKIPKLCGDWFLGIVDLAFLTLNQQRQ